MFADRASCVQANQKKGMSNWGCAPDPNYVHEREGDLTVADLMRGNGNSFSLTDLEQP